MKYSSGDKLWYVSPFIFDICRVSVDMGYIGEDGRTYYIDSESGAELAEHDLYDMIGDAANHCRCLLEKFYSDKKYCVGLIIKNNSEFI